MFWELTDEVVAPARREPWFSMVQEFPSIFGGCGRTQRHLVYTGVLVEKKTGTTMKGVGLFRLPQEYGEPNG